MCPGTLKECPKTHASPVLAHIFCTVTCSIMFCNYITNYRFWNWLKQESKLGGAVGERLVLERTGLWISEIENQYFWAEYLLRWVSPAPTQNSLGKSCRESPHWHDTSRRLFSLWDFPAEVHLIREMPIQASFFISCKETHKRWSFENSPLPFPNCIPIRKLGEVTIVFFFFSLVVCSQTVLKGL